MDKKEILARFSMFFSRIPNCSSSDEQGLIEIMPLLGAMTLKVSKELSRTSRR